MYWHNLSSITDISNDSKLGVVSQSFHVRGFSNLRIARRGRLPQDSELLYDRTRNGWWWRKDVLKW